MKVKFFRVDGLPDTPFARGLFIETVGRSAFAVWYSFDQRRSFVVLPESSAAASRICSVAPGIELAEASAPIAPSSNASVMTLYRSIEGIPPDFMGDMFNVGIGSGFICMLFVPDDEKGITRSREYIEKRLGKISKNIGYSVSEGGTGKRISRSATGRDFANSDEATLLEEMLESLNRSVLRNGIAYRIAFVASGDEQCDYLLSKLFCIESHKLDFEIGTSLDHFAEARALHFGQEFAEKLINFHGYHNTRYIIPAGSAKSSGEVPVGSFMRDSVYDTKEDVMISPQSMNLGFIISGLPGSGKTRAAMSILDSVVALGKGTLAAVISPTDEWNGFALSHRMNLVRICNDRLPINFFRCPEGADVERFYESLAMVLASASSAGPYRNPMEKCMLNAFRRVYRSTGGPDPVEAYSEIEESIIRMHGKRTNTGVKYTKHGENIKSGMENLLSILQMPEYSEKEGLRIEELLKDGIVFDISSAGVETRPYFYALILNQIYSIASSFGSDGDGRLRLAICLEEAQMMLKDPRSPAVEDIKYRMQDFRKKGIGLMLLAHNISDIETGIRRLCQLKIYLKQAADVAEMAANDLTFSNVEQDSVISKLKHLDSRVGALSYVSKDGTESASHDTIFIRTKEYMDKETRSPNPVIEYAKRRGLAPPGRIMCNIAVDTKGIGISGLRISYLGEEVFECSINGPCSVKCTGLIRGRAYTVELTGERGRSLYKEKIIAARNVKLGY